jgi:hypothetical protein
MVGTGPPSATGSQPGHVEDWPPNRPNTGRMVRDNRVSRKGLWKAGEGIRTPDVQLGKRPFRHKRFVRTLWPAIVYTKSPALQTRTFRRKLRHPCTVKRYQNGRTLTSAQVRLTHVWGEIASPVAPTHGKPLFSSAFSGTDPLQLQKRSDNIERISRMLADYIP